MSRLRAFLLPDDRGAALLTVLMLVALMSALIAVAFDRTGIALNRTRARIGVHEARFDLMSAEAIGLARLTAALGSQSDAKTNPRIFNSHFRVPVPGGEIRARVNDGGTCFNLNALVQTTPSGEWVSVPAMVEQFARVMERTGLPQDQALSAAWRAADWIDSDTLPLVPGSEGGRGLTFPNQPMVDPSELRAASGMAAESYGAIKPLVCALPETVPPRYNVNALKPEQAALVAALLDRSVPTGAVVDALSTRPAGGYGYAQDLLAHPALRAFVQRGEAAVQLVTKSDWFRLDLDARLGASGLAERALIDARNRPVTLVHRSYGET